MPVTAGTRTLTCFGCSRSLSAESSVLSLEEIRRSLERHRMSIDRWFYPCSYGTHCGLASMYEGEDRFKQSIDEHGEGLTSFLAEAIRANAARQQD